jgi:SAM-dependent methyltransferase
MAAPVAAKEVPRKPLEMLVQGFPQFRVLATAVDWRIFSRLPRQGATPDELATIYGIEERPARIFLTALAAMGLLEKKGARYRNTPLAARYLVEGRPGYYGDFVTMMDRRLYGAYRHLERSLRSNAPVTSVEAMGDVFRSMAGDPSMTRLFTMGMHATGAFWAEELARRVDFSRHRLLLDVGGGSGVFSIALCQRYKRLRAVVFDVPVVLEIAREKVREADLESRITTAAGEFFRDPWPEGADVVLFSAVLHDWPPDTSKALLRKASELLPEGGEVVIRELFSDDEGAGPLYAAMSSVTMLLDTQGENYSWGTYESWLRGAGFGRFRRVPFPTTAASGALVARKL